MSNGTVSNGTAAPRPADVVTTASPAGAAATLSRLRSTFAAGRTRPLAWRHAQLRALIDLLRRQAPALTQAMGNDLGKPAVEGWLTDVAAVRKDIEGIDHNLDRWAAPRPVEVPWVLQPARAQVVPEPLGTVLVVGPWNYPVRCLVLPLAFALAAGNTAVAKPSELAPATSAALAELIGAGLDADAVAVVEGGADIGAELLAEPWDHIFFTGGARVGRLVMEAAARHLTPVTLELGGKNPAIVAADADLRTAAPRIVWGKYLNAGQTCVAPDYVLVDRAVEEAFVAEVGRCVAKFFGADPARSPDLARVVDGAHLRRLVDLVAATAGRVVVGGGHDVADRYMAPTVVTGVTWDDPLMQEEIFGPVLPVLAYDDLGQALAELRARDKPLALYVYTEDERRADEVIASTSSGSVCVNHNAVQLAVPALPFGGVGASGMGVYHGQAGFDTFSHTKSVLRKPPRGEIPIMYPPYTRAKEWVLRQVMG